MSNEQKVLLERHDDVAVITLNVPARHNAIDLEMVQILHRMLDDLAAADEVAALVVTGAGEKAFAAGADIAQLKERKAREALAAINSALFKKVEDLPLPVIAAVRGLCLGGGCELAMACDLRVIGESAKMGQPEVSLGIIPGAGGTYRLPRLVGLGVAREMIYTGRILDAQECLRVGLANRVVADGDVMDQAMALAREIASRGRLAVRLAKAAMNALARPGEAVAMTLESVAQAVLFDSEDKHRRMEEFLSRKKKKREEG
ncbi:MAG: enoyl-CoA hydratase/isomerase family protein [Planctomycetota bacterium]|jgi:enoyl-CoA hydratase